MFRQAYSQSADSRTKLNMKLSLQFRADQYRIGCVIYRTRYIYYPGMKYLLGVGYTSPSYSTFWMVKWSTTCRFIVYRTKINVLPPNTHKWICDNLTLRSSNPHAGSCLHRDLNRAPNSTLGLDRLAILHRQWNVCFGVMLASAANFWIEFKNGLVCSS